MSLLHALSTHLSKLFQSHIVESMLHEHSSLPFCYKILLTAIYPNNDKAEIMDVISNFASTDMIERITIENKYIVIHLLLLNALPLAIKPLEKEKSSLSAHISCKEDARSITIGQFCKRVCEEMFNECTFSNCFETNEKSTLTELKIIVDKLAFLSISTKHNNGTMSLQFSSHPQQIVVSRDSLPSCFVYKLNHIISTPCDIYYDIIPNTQTTHVSLYTTLLPYFSRTKYISISYETITSPPLSTLYADILDTVTTTMSERDEIPNATETLHALTQCILNTRLLTPKYGKKFLYVDDGGCGLYLQYTHTRITSILRHASQDTTFSQNVSEQGKEFVKLAWMCNQYEKVLEKLRHGMEASIFVCWVEGFAKMVTRCSYAMRVKGGGKEARDRGVLFRECKRIIGHGIYLICGEHGVENM